MTDKERLEEIKEAYRWAIDNSLVPRLSDSDTEWLINRVKELEKKLSINTNNMKQLQKENERYRKALEEIRDEESEPYLLDDRQRVYTMTGRIALEALGGK